MFCGFHGILRGVVERSGVFILPLVVRTRVSGIVPLLLALSPHVSLSVWNTREVV